MSACQFGSTPRSLRRERPRSLPRPSRLPESSASWAHDFRPGRLPRGPGAHHAARRAGLHAGGQAAGYLLNRPIAALRQLLPVELADSARNLELFFLDQLAPLSHCVVGTVPGGLGETCGAVSGSVLALGFFFGSMDQKGHVMFPPSMTNGGVFMDKFKKEYTSTRCWEIQKFLYGRYFDYTKPEDLKLFMEVAKKRPNCLDVTQKAVLIAADIILANS